MSSSRRRDVLKMVGAAALGAYSSARASAAERPVRVGLVGVGNRGTSHVRTLLDVPGVELPAICDINEENLGRAQGIVEKAGRSRPEGYSRGVEDFRRMVQREDLDAILTATPWEWHTPVCVAAMKAGKYAATEVPAAITVEECWELVNTSEQTGKPCMILENVCYYRNVMMVLNMIRQGVLGELVHAEGGYQHDVRAAKISPTGEIKWRGMHSVKRNANLYPTHPIGPIAWWLDINRGDRFTYLVSMSSKSRGINHYVSKRFGAEHPNAKRAYALGDVNTTLIQTARGLTVTLYHDTQSPRPYDLILRVQGTEGIYSGTLDKVFVEGRSPMAGARRNTPVWEELNEYYAKYEHPIWKTLGQTAKQYPHGPADYIELEQFVQAVRNRSQTPIDVYDSATWSVITPLSERSVAGKSAAIDFPDFTRGKWQSAKPVEIRG
ncbi:MAG TPA: Gfo/Idh/MocA family oxidoreductase [Bryobacteraceae bacterium]|nr:Gfo/Idh/MocA family oxidoreductase [Bryobacteraceae bacterium]